jgi:predicted GTPase
VRAVALIDGEHYAPVVRAALAELPYDFVGAHLLGGTEKLRGGDEYGVPLAATLEAALEAHGPEVVVDLSDEPVLGPRERFAVASRVLARGLPYVGADFRFDPPPFEPFALPSLGIVGTGKRVGKTAITAHAAQLLSRDREVVVVSMGRGGPAEPEVAEVAPTVEALLALSDAGRHAASDYLETAALVGVRTIGCRRCGGGLAGLGAPVVATTLRPRPVEPVSGRRVAFFSTAPESALDGLGQHLEREHGAEVTHVSGSLSDRGLLRRELESVEAEVFLVELKAAAIDVVAAAGRERGIDVVLAGSDVRSDAAGPGLDEELLRLAREAAA